MRLTCKRRKDARKKARKFVGRPPLAHPRERVELRLDSRLLRRARAIARDAGASSLQSWLVMVVNRAVEGARLYG